MSPPSRPGYPVVEGGHQLMVPAADEWWPGAVLVAVSRHSGRRYLCPDCGARVWTAFGRARRHRVMHARALLEANGYAVTAPARQGG